METIGDGAAVFLGATTPASDVAFRQGHDFFYMTGVEIPDAMLVVDGLRNEGWTSVELSLLKQKDVPADAVTMKVTARMWAWSFEYPNGVRVSSMCRQTKGCNDRVEERIARSHEEPIGVQEERCIEAGRRLGELHRVGGGGDPAERLPHDCHRRILAEYLSATRGVEVVHL